MKRIFKSLVAMVLALALTFTFAPASAQAAGLKARIGTLGKTYKVGVTLPGNVEVKANVTVTDYRTAINNGVSIAYTKFHVEYPRKQKNIIKRNTTRILKSCPVKKTSGFMKTVYGPADIVLGAFDRSGRLLEQSNSLRWGADKVGYVTETTFTQNGNTLRMDTSYDVEIAVVKLASLGDVYMGAAGATKPVATNNKKYKKLMNGSTTLKKAGFGTKKTSNVFVFG